MELVDTHCHLQFDKLTENIDDVMRSAAKAGVTRMVCVGTSVEDSRAAIDHAAVILHDPPKVLPSIPHMEDDRQTGL